MNNVSFGNKFKFPIEFELKFQEVNCLWIWIDFIWGGGGVQTSLEKSGKFYLKVIFMNMDLVGHICIQEIEVSIQLSSWLGLK
jgi:hypothetical protein